MRKWGPTKSFVRRARQALQRMYDHLWMKSEGLELATALIADSQKHLGLTDRETLTEKHSLGSHYYHWGTSATLGVPLLVYYFYFFFPPPPTHTFVEQSCFAPFLAY